MRLCRLLSLFTLLVLVPFGTPLLAQGVTVGALSGRVSNNAGEPLPGATIVAVHEPTGISYSSVSRGTGAFDILNMRVGGPYSVTVTFVGFKPLKQTDIFVKLGQRTQFNWSLTAEQQVEESLTVVATQDEVFQSDRTGAATSIAEDQVEKLPSIKRSTRDLARLDPRSDGNLSFGGRNWLYNNISLDGSYFNNPYGLDDPAPGGQTSAEPVPYDAIEQVHVSVAPFDVREGGFTGAGINSVTKSGTNRFEGSVYSFTRNEDLIGDEVNGQGVLNPDLTFRQTGIRFSGPLIKDKLFFFANAEVVRREDPGTNFAPQRDGSSGASVSRVRASDLEAIRQRMRDVYGYETGPFEGYINETNNDKIILKLDWNINQEHKLSFRYSRLDAERDLPPHPFAISINNSGRGPNESSLPFQNSGYSINNQLDSVAIELNSFLGGQFANRFFVSYNRFRDFRTPLSDPFPTIEIAENGITYTTLGHEPFSINNVLDQDVFQLTNNFSIFSGDHVYTIGTTFETFNFFNSFNLFYFGVFPAPPQFGGSSFSSLADFFDFTDPNSANFRDFNAEVQQFSQNRLKGDDIEVGQWALYAQDEWQVNQNFNLTYGLRIDMPIYFTDVPTNTFTQGLTLLDENGNPEIVDAGKFPSSEPLFSPRVGFNWNVGGRDSLQVRGGTGIFTGRLPFVWIGNTVSNQGPNAEFPSFDINATDPDFEWPQVWTTDLAVDYKLPWDIYATAELIYGKDLNSIYVRNADLAAPIGTLPGPDGRVIYDRNNNSLNNLGGAGVYVLDNTDDGHNFTATTQFRKRFESGLQASLAYTFLEAKNQLSSTEIASFLWQFNAVKGNPNQPEASYSEFGQQHRFIGSASYRHEWNERIGTSFGMFFEVAEGSFSNAGRRSRFSYVYAGDVNGDGQGGNDLIYIPRDASEINFAPILDASGNVIASVQQQWNAFNQFIQQDPYLSGHRGQIADRNGGINPWYTNIDLRILQDVAFTVSGNRHAFQLSFDILNLGNLFNSDWGAREVANSGAISPLVLNGFNDAGEPVFQFPGGSGLTTYSDDVSLNSRWQVQVGVRYLFE